MERRTVEVRAGAAVEVRASLKRVVDTRGWISADLHVHAAPSFDAPVLLADRVRSLAAVDVQVAAATDHNRLTDYGPTIRGMGLERRLASIIGNEVTTRDVRLGHFNAFPLAAGAAPVPVDQLPPAGLFAAMRAGGKPGEPMVVQVNHPRMGDIGYLDLLRMDERDVAGWRARAPLADLGFEALEVFNGDHYADVPKVERAMRDWYALLDAGLHIVATGNSDTHKVTFQEAGVPRNWVAVPDDDPGAFDERAFIAAVRAGRVIVSSGPFVTLLVAGQPIGATVAAGTVPVEIEVQAPPWIDVAHVELLRRGRVIRSWHGPFAGDVRRLREQLDLEVATGDWLLVVVRGEAEMAPLHRSGARPFAFTNPVWVR
ncbi:MAG: CehA/McbA family metallohydrolase [Polyangiaceae bacterium]